MSDENVLEVFGTARKHCDDLPAAVLALAVAIENAAELIAESQSELANRLDGIEDVIRELQVVVGSK